MSTIILHISDLHLDPSSVTVDPAKISATLREFDDPIDGIVVVFTGDLTNTGAVEEFDALTEFADILISNIRSVTGRDAELVAVPGNHDCDLSGLQTARDLVLDGIMQDPSKGEQLDILKLVTAPQNKFFSWLAERSSSLFVSEDKRICWVQEIPINGSRTISFVCLNTAWMSRIHERQGGIVVPVAAIPEINNSDVTITLMHHSYEWIQATNGRDLRRTIGSISDFVLAGHNHDADSFRVSGSMGDDTQYLEGGALWPGSIDESAFSVVEIDFKHSRFRARTYRIHGDRYRKDEERSSGWNQFSSKTEKGHSGFKLKGGYSHDREEVGDGLTHNGNKLYLDDIYVDPDLETVRPDVARRSIERDVVDSLYTISTLIDEKYVMIGGDTRCGKTSLLNSLYRRVRYMALLPVWVDGTEFSSANANHVSATIRKAFESQYSKGEWDQYRQLDPELKVLFIDDLQSTEIGAEERSKICSYCRSKYGHVYVSGGELLQLEELVEHSELGMSNDVFARYEVLPFGHLLRRRLIEKWIALDVGLQPGSPEFVFRCNEYEGVVNTVLGNNLIPSVPFYVLVIIERYESTSETRVANGAYGFFYEYIITSALSRSKKSEIEVDAKYTFLAELAWRMYKSGGTELDRADLDEFGKGYWSRFRFPGDHKPLLEDLFSSSVLAEVLGSVEFRYDYIHSYFVARFMRDKMNDPEIAAEIDLLVEGINKGKMANILMFLTYLTRDSAIVEKMLSFANGLFADVGPFEIDSGLEFLKDIDVRWPVVTLPSDDAQAARDRVRRDRDRVENGKKRDRPKDEDDEGATSLESIVGRFECAMKTVQILGQFVRNFSGSLEAPQKQELVRESVDLGLRSLNAIYIAMESHSDEFLNQVVELERKRDPGKTDEEVRSNAIRGLFFICEVLCFGTIRRIATAVGSRFLLPIFDDIDKLDAGLSRKAVQVAVRLDYSKSFPKKIVLDMHKKLGNNHFGLMLLRLMVASHFYVFPRSFRIKQQICAKLNIQQTPKMIVGSQKKFASSRR